jgi:hypothetical protein
MHKSATKCNKTIGKWCKNKHGASKIIDTFETYHHRNKPSRSHKRSNEALATGQSEPLPSWPIQTRRHHLELPLQRPGTTTV